MRLETRIEALERAAKATGPDVDVMHVHEGDGLTRTLRGPEIDAYQYHGDYITIIDYEHDKPAQAD